MLNRPIARPWTPLCTRRSPAGSLVLLVLALSLSQGSLWAQGPPNLPGVSVDPILEGAASFAGEWNAAAWVQDASPPPPPIPGTMYGESKLDWRATSFTGNRTTYPGITGFFLHDISNLVVRDEYDYNTFFLATSGRSVTLWVFGNGDEPNDAQWILGSGINRSSIDDRGFLVRSGNNPTTDRQWFLGQPVPGDPAWEWSSFYGVCGFYGFNNTCFDSLLANSVDGTNEVYEVAFRMLAGNSPGIPPCTFWTLKVCDPKGDGRFQVNLDRLIWVPHIGDDAPPLIRAQTMDGEVSIPCRQPTTFSFAFVNLGYSLLARTYSAWAKIGTVSPSSVDVLLDGQANTVLPFLYTPSYPCFDGPDTLFVTSPADPEHGIPADTSFTAINLTTVRRLDIPVPVMVCPETPIFYVSAFASDANGNEVRFSPTWTCGGSVISAEPVMESSVPETMALALCTVGAPGAGWVRASYLPPSGSEVSDTIMLVGSPADLPEAGESMGALSLRVSPQPAGGTLTIDYSSSEGHRVTIQVIDVAGRRVRTFELIGGPGRHQSWDGLDDSGRPVAPGLYVCRISDGGSSTSTKFAWLGRSQ